MAQVMPEVANCPVCGKEPIWAVSQLTGKVTIQCCKVCIGSFELWNRYAAAMELAIATAAYFTLATEAGHKRLQEAGKRLLEVFK